MTSEYNTYNASFATIRQASASWTVALSSDCHSPLLPKLTSPVRMYDYWLALVTSFQCLGLTHHRSITTVYSHTSINEMKSLTQYLSITNEHIIYSKVIFKKKLSKKWMLKHQFNLTVQERRNSK